ncbi:type II secretion system protein N [Colwelliaceae bacterium 6471]
MKKWFAYGAIFLCVYFTFVVATVPATLVTNWISIPKNIAVSGISGTIWQAKATSVSHPQITLNDVDIELGVMSLLKGDPLLELSFGGALFAGPEGSLSISGLLDELKIENGEMSIAANDIAKQLALPVPLTAHGYVSIKVPEFVIGQPICKEASGQIVWNKASITALEEKINLGALKADVTCEQGALAIALSPSNDLGLTFTAYLRGKGNVSGNGYLTPGAKFPEQLKAALPFLGKADNKGRYRLSL